jgi:RNA polymerase sigma factor (sigma-70 family)
VTPRRAAPEADATRDLYERYARQIYAYCFHQLGSREEAEDATQSTFLNAFRGLQRGVDPEFETAWLYKIAQNVCLTRQRSSSRRRRLETPGDLDAMQDYVPAHQPDSDELIHLPEALDAMPEQQRRALLLREWQGLSYKEIGDELGLSQPAVETLLFRARRTLAASLTDEPVAKKSVGKKLQRGTDAGSVAALVKAVLLSGGAKVAATVATVAATSAVVAASPATHHAVVDVATPRPDIVPVRRVVVHEPVAPAAVAAPAAAAPVRELAAVVPVRHVTVVRRAPRRVAVREHAVAHVHVVEARAPVPAAPAPQAPAPAPAAQPVVAETTPAPAPTPRPSANAPGQQKKVDAAPPAPAPVADTHADGNGHAHGRENTTREPLAVPGAATTVEAATTPAEGPAPVDPAANGDGPGNGNGVANGHEK